MKRFSLRLSDAEYEKLKAYCNCLEISINDAIRQSIREWNPPIFSRQVFGNLDSIEDRKSREKP